MVDRAIIRATASCPALFFCAPASGQGKTTITAGIARYHRNQGLKVRVFKTGPDYLDPLILEQACGHPVTQLDLWMVGEAECKRILHEAAAEADLILIEGVMGLFDGNPSAADMAQFFGIPIAIVINAKSMAQTFGAIALGLTSHRVELNIAGVIANALGSERHQQLITEAMPEHVKLLGCVKRHPEATLPERHLGLVQPREVSDIDHRLDALAQIMHTCGLTDLPETVTFKNDDEAKPAALLKGLTIAIARDDAFTFIYAANVRLLETMGASCVYFSPLEDSNLPKPMHFGCRVATPNSTTKNYLQINLCASKLNYFIDPVEKYLAECGGMLYLMETLTDVEGKRENMVGLLSGHGIMRDRGGCQGMQYAPLPQGEIRAHAHHRTRCEGTIEPLSYGRRLHHPAAGEPIYQTGNLTASYLHLYFPSNPEAVAQLLS